MRAARLLPLFVLGLATPLLAQNPDSATIASMKWRSIGPVNMAGRITDVEGDPHDGKVFYISGATGGIWKTDNAGTTFVPLWDHGPIASMGDIALSASDSKIIWAGTGEQNSRNSVSPGFGVYKTVDGGTTWQSMGLEKTEQIGRIVVHPTNPNIVYVAALGAQWAANPERGLYKTTDGGKTWTMSKFISDKAGFVDVVMDPRDPNTLYAASWQRVRKPAYFLSGGPGSALWKTTDGGSSWHEIKGGGFPATEKGRMNIQISRSNPNIVYVMVEADSVRGKKPQRLLSGLYRSEDAGKTWKWMSTIDNRPFYFSQIRVDPKNPNRIYRLAVDFQFSDDGGHSWRLGMLGQHEDYHGMWIDPNDPMHYIIGGDAGIFQTWDRGGNYDAVNNMAMGQFYGVSYDFQVPYRVCGGLQDNGSSCGWSRRRNGELHMDDWFALFAADGLRTAQDPSDPNIIYYESQGGNMSRKNLATGETTNIKPRTVTSGTFGAQIERIKGDGTTPLTAAQQQEIAGIRATMKKEMSDPNVATRWNWNTPFILSVHDANVIYSGGDKVFKSVQKGSSPFAISPDFSAANLDWIRVSSGYDENGDAAKDASGGITRDATGAEENATIVTVAESPIRAGLIFAGTDDGKLEMSRNDGGSWENIGGHFPGAPAVIHIIGIEPSHVDSATIYAALDNHRENDFKPYLYVTHDWGKTWTSISSNLPTNKPGSTYVIREDPVNANLLYCGTETGAFASLNKGGSWFQLTGNLPTVPVYDLQIHPRDHELIAGTHGRAVQILDVAPLQQMKPAVLAASTYLFAPTTAFIYAQMIQGSQPRAQRPWMGEGGPSGAEIEYRLAAATTTPVRVMVVNAAGDTVARLTGTQNAGINRVSWNFVIGDAGGRGGRGGGGGGRGGAGPVSATRPSESTAAPDSTGSPNEVVVAGAGRGARGGGGGGGFGGRGAEAETGDYRVVLDVGGQKMVQVLRVVKVEAGQVSVR